MFSLLNAALFISIDRFTLLDDCISVFSAIYASPDLVVTEYCCHFASLSWDKLVSGLLEAFAHRRLPVNVNS